MHTSTFRNSRATKILFQYFPSYTYSGVILKAPETFSIYSSSTQVTVTSYGINLSKFHDRTKSNTSNIVATRHESCELPKSDTAMAGLIVFSEDSLATKMKELKTFVRGRSSLEVLLIVKGSEIKENALNMAKTLRIADTNYLRLIENCHMIKQQLNENSERHALHAHTHFSEIEDIKARFLEIVDGEDPVIFVGRSL
ncbi:hypothetical protein PSPO01_06320 [Paraphaeosphaeria sporulosa]